MAGSFSSESKVLNSACSRNVSVRSLDLGGLCPKLFRTAGPWLRYAQSPTRGLAVEVEVLACSCCDLRGDQA